MFKVHIKWYINSNTNEPNQGDIAMNLIYKELLNLVNDYYKCECIEIKELILSDIQFLTEELCKMESPSLHLEMAN